MPFSKPITFRRLLNAPIDEPNLIPPRKPGVYVVTQHDWPGGGDPPDGDVVYVGETSRAKDPHLLYRVAGLVADAIGFTGEGIGSKNSYYHSGGNSIWNATKDKILKGDPRDLYISWRSDGCGACEENRLVEHHKTTGSPIFLTKQSKKCTKH